MTLPQDRNSFKVAVFSCSNFPSGYFNVYRDAANDQSIDLGIHVGDYIYEYKQGEYATEDAVKLGRVPIPDKDITTLIDYRLRHSQYKTDKDLQKIHLSQLFQQLFRFSKPFQHGPKTSPQYSQTHPKTSQKDKK